MKRWVPVLVAAASATAVAGLGALMTDLGPWYQGLAQPSWKPPDAAFGPIWTVIFALAAASGVVAWRRARTARDREMLLLLFALNGFLNVLWSLLYFRLHRPDWALAEVGFLWFSVLGLMVVLGRWARFAAGLLAPYLIWVTIAACLNLATVRLNGPFGAATDAASTGFSTVRLVDLVIAVTVLEGFALLLYSRMTGRDLVTGGIVPALAAGFCLMLALRAALTGAATVWLGLALLLAGVAHAVDVARRWKVDEGL